ncbi:MAG TPA: hypothetical protein VLZ83_12420 [Edaphocola sp.]|nr:hypothetical protein [Edaphocola sp.]
MSTPGNDHFIMPFGYMVEGTYVYLSADRLGTGKSIGMKRLEAYIYNSMMEMAEAKQQKVIEIRFAAALEMINGYNIGLQSIVSSYDFPGMMSSQMKSGYFGGNYKHTKGEGQKKKEYTTPNLNGRPPTRKEANLHYMYGNGELLDVDLAKVDLLFLNPTDFNEKVGTRKVVQTLWSSDDGRVFGNITLTYIGHDKVIATYGFDIYDFDMHSWGNPINWVRNAATIYGDPGDGTPFRINFYGEGRISPLPAWRQKAYEIINQGIIFFTPNIPR